MRSAIVLSFWLALTFAWSSQVWSSVLVLSSDANSITVGSQIEDNQLVILGSDETISVMDVNSAETRVLIGPYHGRVGDYINPCESGRSPEVCAKLKKKIAGATRKLNQSQ